MKKQRKHLVDKEFLKELGNRVRELRKDKGYTQEKLANSINVEISQISRLERGVTNAYISLLKEISTEFDMKLKDFFDFEYTEESIWNK